MRLVFACRAAVAATGFAWAGDVMQLLDDRRLSHGPATIPVFDGRNGDKEVHS